MISSPVTTLTNFSVELDLNVPTFLAPRFAVRQVVSSFFIVRFFILIMQTGGLTASTSQALLKFATKTTPIYY